MTNGCPLPHSSATRSPVADAEPGQTTAHAVDLVAQLAVGDLLVAADERDRVGGVPVDDVGDVHQLDVVRPALVVAPMTPGDIT